MDHVTTRESQHLQAGATLLVVGRLGHHPPFVGTVAECNERHPELDLSGNASNRLWFGDLRLCLGLLIDPTSPAAHAIHAAVTGETDAASSSVESWLMDDASHRPHLRGLLAFTAYRQGAITADQFRLVLAECA